MTDKKLKEGLGDMAHMTGRVHEDATPKLRTHANNLNKHIPDNKRSGEFVKIMATKYAAKYSIDADDLFDTYVAMFNVHQPQSPFLKNTNEGLGDMAHMAERDHEVQMARAELYKIAKYAIKLHELLKNVTEAEGLEGWQQAKITKAGDYISSVFHSLEYDQKVMTPESKTFKSSMTEAEVVEYKLMLEKAKSKAQQKFMGMVHAAQKGEKPASKEVAKVAKDMPKKAAKDYASTKHKGKPEHVKKK